MIIAAAILYVIVLRTMRGLKKKKREYQASLVGDIARFFHVSGMIRSNNFLALFFSLSIFFGGATELNNVKSGYLHYCCMVVEFSTATTTNIVHNYWVE